MRKTIHMCIDIEGALANAKRHGTKYLDGMLKGDDGHHLTGESVARFLIKYRNETGKAYFCNCDNQTPEGRCAGHEEGEG